MILELVEQCVILVGQCHNRQSYFRRQRVLTALFKDRRNVKSLLKEGPHCFEKEQKVLLGERFQKKVNKTIKSKKKKKELLKEYTKRTPAKRPYDYGSLRPPFRQGPHSSLSGWGYQSYQNQGFVPRDGQRKFHSRGGRGKLKPGLPWTPTSSISPRPKTLDLLNLSDHQKPHPFVKTLFKENRETFPLTGRS